MIERLLYDARQPTAFPDWRFETLDFEYDANSRSVWMSFKEDGSPCFTFQTLTDMANVRESLRCLFASEVITRFPVQYVVLSSNKPGVFNLGGDLAMFANAIRGDERDMLRSYAHACIDVVFGMASAYGLPVVTLAVVAGRALGGGLEAALAQDFVFADEAAVLGVPEVAFNTFPGMGAITLLTRRIGAARTERLVVSGDSYSGQQMLDLGVVDRLAPKGTARQAALTWMGDGNEALHARRLTVTQARRTCFPVTFSELIKIVDLWTETSFGITKRDLRHMDRLVVAQRRMLAA